MEPTFKWRCSYAGTVWYDVTDHTGSYEVELRHSASEYHLATANGDDVRRDMLASIGLLRRASGYCRDDGRMFEVPASTVDAFNRWRVIERAKHIAEMKAQPARYGDIDENDATLFPPIVPAWRGYYVLGKGWQRSE